MSTWFEGSNEVECSIRQVERALDDLGAHYVEVISLMPGLTSVELVEQGPDSVVIRTNEGLMKRTGISRRVGPDRVTIELDEEYQAGSKVKTTSHFLDEFTASGTGVTHHLVISDLRAPGLLGFFYRRFGGGNTGRAFLQSTKALLER